MSREYRRVYATVEWDRARDVVIMRSNGLCERCTSEGRIVAGVEVHHKIPLTNQNWREWDVAYNPENLEHLCKTCHDIEHDRTTGLHQFVRPVNQAGER